MATIFFAVLVLVVRVSTFFRSVENWDESLYLLMARSVLDGHTLYTEIWDHKPPGIFYLFAALQLVFGRTVLAIRIGAWLAITASCVLLFVLGRRLRSETTGVVAGLLYAAYSLNDGGLASNVEIFFTPLLLLALLLALSTSPRELLARPTRPFVLGVVGGLALQFKYVVAFDLVAFFLFLLPALLRERQPLRLLRFALLAGVGVAVPFAAVASAFATSGHFADYVDANFAANARYIGEVGFDWPKVAVILRRRLAESFPLWLSVVLAAGYLAFWRDLDRETRRGLAAGLVWAGFAFAGMCVLRRFFAHYFLALTTPLCLVAALVIGAAVETSDRRASARTVLLLLLVLSGPLLRAVGRPLEWSAEMFHHHVWLRDPLWEDEPAQIAEYLRPRIGSDDYLYVADYHPILYYLLPVRIPTRFALPTHLADELWEDLTGFDPAAEVRSIFEKRPLYVVKAEEHDTPFYRVLHQELDDRYGVEQTIGAVEIWRRRDR
jgi:4-amino-4-deoxy-L-arabinose transferase-like glycosyltransferase